MRRLMILGALLCLLTAGCGDSDTDDETATSGPDLPESLCEQVSAADLEKWSGAPRTLKEPQTGAGYTICGTELGDDGLNADWRFTELDDGGLQELIETRAPAGARTGPVILGGETRGFAFHDDSGTGPSYVLAVEYGDDAALLVTTSIAGDMDPAAGRTRAKPAALEPLATKIATFYANSLGEEEK